MDWRYKSVRDIAEFMRFYFKTKIIVFLPNSGSIYSR